MLHTVVIVYLNGILTSLDQTLTRVNSNCNQTFKYNQNFYDIYATFIALLSLELILSTMNKDKIRIADTIMTSITLTVVISNSNQTLI